MYYRRVLTIQDISCVGQCSGTVAVPIISACGMECAIVPSAVLSTHTAEAFGKFTLKDLTTEIPKIRKHWEKQDIRFDCIYTGYLCSEKQIDHVIDMMDSRLALTGVRVVDPVMGDNGKMYTNFDEEFVVKMRELCRIADIIIPNVTEGCLLTGMEYQEEYDQNYIDQLLLALNEMGARCIILTGVSFHPETTGVMIYEEGFTSYYEHRKVDASFHGTGDVFASAFTGALMHEIGALRAAVIAADFTVDCLLGTVDDKDKHWYGVKFEPQIPELLKALEIVK